MLGELLHVEKCVSLYQPDIVYQYAGSFRELDYVLVFRNAIVVLEKASDSSEWNKRIVDVRIWGLPVFWHGQPGQKVPCLPQAPSDLIQTAEQEWMKWQAFSLLARDAASELYALTNFTALMLPSEVAEKVLEDVEESCRRATPDEDAVGIAARYVHRLACAYRVRLAISPEGLKEVRGKLLLDLLKELSGNISAILFLPRIVHAPGVELGQVTLIKRQAELASYLIEKLERSLFIVTNESVKEQCRTLKSLIKQERRDAMVDTVEIDGINKDERRHEAIERLTNKGLEGKTLLMVIADDYNKGMAFALLRALVSDLKNEVHVLVIPYAKIKAAAPSSGGRLDEMKSLWRVLSESENVFDYETLYLMPDDVKNLVGKLKTR